VNFFSECYSFFFADHTSASRAAVVHLNFLAGSTFPIPVCTVSPGHWVNNRTRLTWSDFRLNLLLLKVQRCVAFCSSLLDLRILIPCRQGKMHFSVFCFSFSLILRLLLFLFHAEVSTFSDRLCCGLMMQLFKHPVIVHIHYIFSYRLEK